MWFHLTTCYHWKKVALFSSFLSARPCITLHWPWHLRTPFNSLKSNALLLSLGTGKVGGNKKPEARERTRGKQSPNSSMKDMLTRIQNRLIGISRWSLWSLLRNHRKTVSVIYLRSLRCHYKARKGRPLHSECRLAWDMNMCAWVCTSIAASCICSEMGLTFQEHCGGPGNPL